MSGLWWRVAPASNHPQNLETLFPENPIAYFKGNRRVSYSTVPFFVLSTPDVC